MIEKRDGAMSPEALFPAASDAYVWDAMSPSRVSPVWNPVPELESFSSETLDHVKTQLVQHGFSSPRLQPLIAGYSGAQPFLLKNGAANFFLKAVLGSGSHESQTKLQKEYQVAKLVEKSDVSAKYLAWHAAAENEFSYFVCDFSTAKPLDAEPFRSELLNVAQGRKAGPFLKEWTRILRGFHWTSAKDASAIGKTTMHSTARWQDNFDAAVTKGLLGDKEKTRLQLCLTQIAASYQLRGASLTKNQAFLHGDMHASNLRLDSERQRLVAIDFGDAGWGDPARELAYFMFMMDVPIALASPLVRLYQKEVTRHSEAFYERSLLALSGDRIERYVQVLGWSGSESNAAGNLRQRIMEDLNFIDNWL